MSCLGIVISLTFMLTGCETSVSPGNGKNEVFEFPVADGSWWHYDVFVSGYRDTSRWVDPLCNLRPEDIEWESEDTISIFIDGVDTLEMTGEVASVLRFSRDTDVPGYWFNRFYVTGAESKDLSEPISFYRSANRQRPWFYFQRPFEDGAEWRCTSCDELWFDDQNYRIDYLSHLSTPSGSFERVFKLSYSYLCGDECGGRYSYWLKSEVGIIKMQRTQWTGMNRCGDTYSTVTWDLVDYEVK